MGQRGVSCSFASQVELSFWCYMGALVAAIPYPLEYQNTNIY